MSSLLRFIFPLLVLSWCSLLIQWQPVQTIQSGSSALSAHHGSQKATQNRCSQSDMNSSLLEQSFVTQTADLEGFHDKELSPVATRTLILTATPSQSSSEFLHYPSPSSFSNTFCVLRL
jgi:hypothetical protein